MDLVGVAELAARAGVARDTVRQWRRRHPDFPKPFVTLAASPVWRWEDIEVWLKKPRPPGRPRKDAP